ncbi:MAG: hypothetical protein COC06_09320 [Bacteroidales bacterium]|nr:MAG: hypothetical protein COC06_09320 [Bacteroidales bacterium]
MVSLVKPEEPKQVIVTENRDKADNEVIIERLTKIDSTIKEVVKEFNQTKLKQLVVTTPKK